MKTIDDVISSAKKQLAKHGEIPPLIVIEGDSREESVLLPQVDERSKLTLLEAVGYTLAKDDRIGNLRQLFFVAEGWGSRAPQGKHPALRPEHDPNRQELLMVSHYQAADDSLRMVLYRVVRDGNGDIAELDRQPQYQSVESPPIAAIVRGFKHGRAG